MYDLMYFIKNECGLLHRGFFGVELSEMGCIQKTSPHVLTKL